MKILVIEDDKIAQLGIKKIFDAAEFPVQITLAENGQQGIDALKKNPSDLPDVILLDLNMPLMNGLEFLQAVDQDDVLKYIPVVVHTTSDNIADIQNCRKLNVSGYFVKSIDYAQYKFNLQTIAAYWSQSKQINIL